jgi:hypothetical protein
MFERRNGLATSNQRTFSSEFKRQEVEEPDGWRDTPCAALQQIFYGVLYTDQGPPLTKAASCLFYGRASLQPRCHLLISSLKTMNITSLVRQLLIASMPLESSATTNSMIVGVNSQNDGGLHCDKECEGR